MEKGACALFQCVFAVRNSKKPFIAIDKSAALLSAGIICPE